MSRLTDHRHPDTPARSAQARRSPGGQYPSSPPVRRHIDVTEAAVPEGITDSFTEVITGEFARHTLDPDATAEPAVTAGSPFPMCEVSIS
jgi:hypothetical protein